MANGLQRLNLGEPLSDYGENLVGSLTLVELAKIPLQIGKNYQGLNISAHCRTGALFQAVYNDNGTEKVIASTGSDPGKPNPNPSDPDFILKTTGKTGVQEIILRAKNFNKANCFRGGISTREFPGT